MDKLDDLIISTQVSQLKDILKRVNAMDTKNGPFRNHHTEYGSGWNNALKNLGDYLAVRLYQLETELKIPLDDRD